MTARLDYKPARADFTQIVAGSPVRSGTWQDAAQIINYVRAKCRVLVPLTQMGTTVSSTNKTFRFRVAPGTTSSAALWLIGIRGAPATIKVPSGGTGIYQSADTDETTVQAYIDPAIDVSTYTETELTFNVTESGAKTTEVRWAACYELPRQFLLLDGVELGVDLQSMLIGQPIVDAAGRSYTEVADAMIDARINNGRRSIYHWFDPDGITSVSSSYAAVLPDFAALNRKLYSGETARNVRFRVYASAVTNNGEFKLESSAGITTQTITAGAAAWYPSTAGAAAAFSIDSEALTQATGLQGGAYKLITPSLKRGAAGSCTLYGLSVWEDPLDC